MEKRWKKLFCKSNLLVLILIGILLFVIALPVKEEGRAGGGEDIQGLFGAGGSQKLSGNGGQTVEQETAGQDEADLNAEGVTAAYARELEQRLTEALTAMDGVGRVKVMITLRSSGELVVEKETRESGSATVETDAKGGSRRVEEREAEESVVYSAGSGSSTPYVIKTYAPEIEGVLVVAQGAGSGTVRRTVTEAVQALFAVEAHKVKVVSWRREGGGSSD